MDEKQKYISNCISDCIKKGKTKEQAAAICYSKWESRKSIVKSLIVNLIKWSKIRKNLDSVNGGALIPQNLAGAKKKRGLKDGSGKGKGMSNGNRKNQNLIPCKEKNRGLGSGKNRE